MTDPDDAPIDVHLADGGHVIVAFADRRIGADPACDGIIAALVHADGTEHDLERAIVERAAAFGLTASVSATHHPTTVLIATVGQDAASPTTASTTTSPAAPDTVQPR